MKLTEVFRFPERERASRIESTADPRTATTRHRPRSRWAGVWRIDDLDFQDTEPSIRDGCFEDPNDRIR